MPDGIDRDERAQAGDTLSRLVRFLASALDVRYAFVAAPAWGEEGTDTLVLWVARNYGLRTEFMVVPQPEGERGTSLDVLAALRLALPLEAEDLALGPERLVSVELLGAGGRPMGCLGILDAERPRGVTDLARLRPLARRAAAELERWAASEGQGDGGGGAPRDSSGRQR